MSDWLTYTPETFLMFSERTYRRLFELHNATLWPAHIAAILAGFVLLAILLRRGAQPGRALAIVLAVAWLAVAVAWLWLRFSTIHTGGKVMAAMFALEAIGLLWFGAVRRRLEVARPAGIRNWFAVTILAFGLLMLPLLGRALGRPWAQSEVFALAPDPTVVATIGALLLVRRTPWYLWVIPVGWSLFTGMTLLAMHTPDWWLAPAIALAAAIIALVSRQRTTSHATK